MPNDISTAIRTAEGARSAAMLAQDLASLDLLLDPCLSFSHATGQVDDKPAYMTKMAAGRIAYLSIEWSDDHVIPLGTTNALLTGRMTSRVRVEGVEKRLDNRVLAVWTFAERGWRMLAFQSTPIRE